MTIELSVISPVYRAEASVDELVLKIVEAASKITESFEIILVEDGSPDGSWQKIAANCAKDSRIKGLKFSRNFGQHFAITAGLEAATGKFVALMDCDLQDDPAYLRQLYDLGKAGNDVVLTVKTSRRHSWTKNVLSSLFGLLFNWLIESKAATFRTDVGTYSLISRKVVDAFLRMADRHRHYLMIIRWLGFTTTYVEIEHRLRPHGRSSYTLRKLINHAIDGITSQSDRLLYLSVGVGLTIFVLSITTAGILVVTYFLHGYREGWTSTMVVSLGSTGLILMSTGIVGIYVGKTFEQSKGRPLYLVDRSINLDS